MVAFKISAFELLLCGTEELRKRQLAIRLKNVLQRTENKNLCKDWPEDKHQEGQLGQLRTDSIHLLSVH